MGQKLPDGSWELEQARFIPSRSDLFFVAGIDEAGRGALAGPVTAACVIFDPPVANYIGLGIKDSKLLSPVKREIIYRAIMKTAKSVSLGWASVKEIDSLNIRSASLLAMRRAVEGALLECFQVSDFLIAIDGMDRIPGLVLDQTAVVGGDRSILSIAAASIVAKVSRDRFMEDIDREYPEYSFREHKGYGTLRHRQIIEKIGLSPFHRPLFCRNIFRGENHPENLR